jgi:hypothetical protein
MWYPAPAKQVKGCKPPVNSLTKMSEVGVEAKAEMTCPPNTEHQGNQGSSCQTELEGIRQG